MELQVERLSHRYGDTDVLSNINLTIEAGKIVCVVGPSGCGKSTLLRLLGGLELATSGSVFMVGDSPAGCINPLTFIFQDFALLPWRSVEGNVQLVLEGQGLNSAHRESIVSDVLSRTRLLDFRAALPRQLSGGMKQRVAIARALAVNPAVLLMDEPLSALDSQTRELLMDDLVSLWMRERFTAVYVTHNLAEAVRLGHRVVVMSRRPGEIREVIDIEIPLDERGLGNVQLETIQQSLWELMRAEALAADLELRNA